MPRGCCARGHPAMPTPGWPQPSCPRAGACPLAPSFPPPRCASVIPAVKWACGKSPLSGSSRGGAGRGRGRGQPGPGYKGGGSRAAPHSAPRPRAMAPPLRPAPLALALALALLCARLGTFSLIVEAWTAKDLEPPTGPDPVLPGAVAVARAGGWALRLRCLPHGHGPSCAPPRRAPRHAPLDCSPLPLCPPGCSETPAPCPEPGGCRQGRGCEDCRIGPCRRLGGCECPGGAPCPCTPVPTPDPPCASRPCAHGGTCQELEGSFACRCPPGFAGRTCERSAPACAARPCFNGGSCAPRPGGAYTCRCPPGFAGSNCERRLDRCAPRPCMHGGHCLDLGRSLLCKCRPGFTGPWCEENMDDCAGSPCANGGTCLDGVGSYSCSCTLGYGGRDCSQRVGACGSSPCLNGGACYTHFSGHVCRCPASYMGARCEFEVPRPPQDPGPAALALSGALMLAALAVAGGLVGATAWCWCHRGVRGAASPCQGLGTIGNLLAPFKGSPQDPGVRDLLGSKQELLEGPGDGKKLEKTPVPGESRSLAGFPAPGAIRPPHPPQPPVFTTEQSEPSWQIGSGMLWLQQPHARKDLVSLSSCQNRSCLLYLYQKLR